MAASRGRLIAVEGGEGAGKSTQAALLAEALGAELSREPGGTPLGEQIRRLLLEPSHGPVAPRAELMLMLAARAQHLAARVEPALSAGRDVVVDRFSGSTVAYQGYGRGLPLDEVRAAIELATAGRDADVSVLVDVPAEVGAARRRGGPDRIEAEEGEFHERVRQGFLAQAAAAPARWIVVDGTGSPEQTAQMVQQGVRDFLASSTPAGS